MRAGSFARFWLVLGLLAVMIFLIRHHIRRTPTSHSTDSLPAPAPHDPHALTVTFWNLQWFPGHYPNASETARQRHVAAVVPVVARLDPDVLGLEEIADADAARLVTGQVRGLRLDVCTAFLLGNGVLGRQQVALCSRLPLVQAWWENWRPGANGIVPRRGFAFAVYQPIPGELLLVYGMHLKSNVADEPGGEAVNVAMREESARQLLAHEQAMAAAYGRMGRVRLAVLGGDMNTSLDDSRFGRETTLRRLLDAGGFRWAWLNVPLERRYTLPASGRYPATCFDHQLYRTGDGGVRILDSSMENTSRDASDHRPVTVRYHW